MTVTNTTNKTTPEIGNGSKTAFDFSFKVFNSSDLEVYLIDSGGTATLKTITTHYTVSLNTITEGGTVTMVTPPTASEYVFIKRVVTKTQTTDIPTEGNFPETQVENALDKAYMLIIQMQEELDRTPKFGITSTKTGVLPEPEDGKILQWSGTGGTLVNAVYDTASLTAAVTSAQTAQAAAETAQTAAETAQTGAQTAQTAAELAETNAETAQAAAEAAVAQINAEIHDADDDTAVEVERTVDVDTIHMKIAGTDEMNITAAGMQLSTGARADRILDEDNMASDSATALATQQSIKAYIDTTLGALLSYVEIFTTSGTWVVPTGVNFILVDMAGGGGAGGSGQTNSASPGGGGGAAETILSHILPVTPGASLTIAIGSGGVGATDTNGTNGGTTSITGGAYTLSVAGGSGGVKTVSGGTGGAGAAGTIDDNALTSIKTSLTPTSTTPIDRLSYPGGDGVANGAGGNSMFGLGGASGASDDTVGDAGQAPGSGGGGGRGNSGTAVAGGAGAKGIVIIRYNANGAPS